MAFVRNLAPIGAAIYNFWEDDDDLVSDPAGDPSAAIRYVALDITVVWITHSCLEALGDPTDVDTLVRLGPSKGEDSILRMRGVHIYSYDCTSNELASLDARLTELLQTTTPPFHTDNCNKMTELFQNLYTDEQQPRCHASASCEDRPILKGVEQAHASTVSCVCRPPDIPMLSSTDGGPHLTPYLDGTWNGCGSARSIKEIAVYTDVARENFYVLLDKPPENAGAILKNLLITLNGTDNSECTYTASLATASSGSAFSGTASSCETSYPHPRALPCPAHVPRTSTLHLYPSPLPLTHPDPEPP